MPLKELPDALGDSLVEIIRVFPRSYTGVNNAYAKLNRNVDVALSNVELRMPQDPRVLPETVVKFIGYEVEAIIDSVKSVASGVLNTAKAVGVQLNRVK